MKKLIMAAAAAFTLAGCAQAEPAAETVDVPNAYSVTITESGEYFAAVEYHDEFGQWSGKVLPVDRIAPHCLDTGKGLYLVDSNVIAPWGNFDETEVNLISVYTGD